MTCSSTSHYESSLFCTATPESNRVPRPATATPPSANQRFPSRQPSPQSAGQNDSGPYGSPTLQVPSRHSRVSSLPSNSSTPAAFSYFPSEQRPSPYGPYAPNQPINMKSQDSSPYRPAPAPQAEAQQPSAPSSVMTSFWDMLHRH